MRARINDRVKFREEFRPLAPAILDEYGDAWFEDYQTSRYMERALRFRRQMAARVPAVVHVDGTGRVQSVRREWNGLFHALIEAFLAQTGVPMVLNTSFNVMGKPIVHSVEDAIAVFLTSDIDWLVIGEDVWQKRQ
jgi:carbamoyltransferase